MSQISNRNWVWNLFRWERKTLESEPLLHPYKDLDLENGNHKLLFYGDLYWAGLGEKDQEKKMLHVIVLKELILLFERERDPEKERKKEEDLPTLTLRPLLSLGANGTYSTRLFISFAVILTLC